MFASFNSLKTPQFSAGASIYNQTMTMWTAAQSTMFGIIRKLVGGKEKNIRLVG
jgi:hypothetical protein